MLKLLKVFIRGIITTLLLPIILLIWVGYGVWCVVMFTYMFFRGVIGYFQGKSFSSELPEDLEARRMILENEKAEQQRKDMLDMMYRSPTSFAQPPCGYPPQETEENISSQSEDYEIDNKEDTDDGFGGN